MLPTQSFLAAIPYVPSSRNVPESLICSSALLLFCSERRSKRYDLNRFLCRDQTRVWIKDNWNAGLAIFGSVGSADGSISQPTRAFNYIWRWSPSLAPINSTLIYKLKFPHIAKSIIRSQRIYACNIYFQYRNGTGVNWLTVFWEKLLFYDIR